MVPTNHKLVPKAVEGQDHFERECGTECEFNFSDLKVHSVSFPPILQNQFIRVSSTSEVSLRLHRPLRHTLQKELPRSDELLVDLFHGVSFPSDQKKRKISERSVSEEPSILR